MYRNKDDTCTICEPSDVVCLTDEADSKLSELWAKDMSIDEPIPTDLFYANTIPLPHFYLQYEEYPRPILVNTNERGVLMVLPTGVIIESGVTEDGLVSQILRGENVTDEIWETLSADEEMRGVLANNLLTSWYGIQIALLHPQIVDVFQNPTREKVYERKGTGKDRKRVVKYVRKHYITAEGIEEALYGKGHRGFERKTMAWYVVGHWRQYRSGARKFIKGYWKGPLREIKRNLDDGRNRIIAT